MSTLPAQDELNRDWYCRANRVADYAKVELNPPEVVALVRYRDDIQSRRVLDLGCGAGRLAMNLRPLTDQYVGLDISSDMVTYCQQTFLGLAFQQGDMRQLPFDTSSFDAVFAVFNLLDAVSHEDRLRTLAEVRRVLKPGGLLVFSSHNRNWKNAGAGPTLKFKLNPLSQLHCLWDYWRSRANHRRVQKMQRTETDYALLNDEAHEFVMLHYYVTREAQSRQLASAGFQLLECLGEDGRTLRAEDEDCNFCSIYYVARSSRP